MERKPDGRAKRGAARRRSFQPQANDVFFILGGRLWVTDPQGKKARAKFF